MLLWGFDKLGIVDWNILFKYIIGGVYLIVGIVVFCFGVWICLDAKKSKVE